MTFNEWLDSRMYRVQATFAHMDSHDWQALLEWLEAAYRIGYQEGRKENEEGSVLDESNNESR
jgi:hypothetical protein